MNGTRPRSLPKLVQEVHTEGTILSTSCENCLHTAHGINLREIEALHFHSVNVLRVSACAHIMHI